MADKPKYASEYKSEQVKLVRATCLYVATKLGDMMDDLLIVGGLVPSLIISQEHLGEDADPHVGTMDLDVGLQVALLNEGRYRQLTQRLRDAGFEMDKNDAGKLARRFLWRCNVRERQGLARARRRPWRVPLPDRQRCFAQRLRLVLQERHDVLGHRRRWWTARCARGGEAPRGGRRRALRRAGGLRRPRTRRAGGADQRRLELVQGPARAHSRAKPMRTTTCQCAIRPSAS